MTKEKNNSPGFEIASLEALGEGKAISQFDYELKRVIENCLDLNTDPGFKRMVKLEAIVTPSADRKSARVRFQATSKIAPDAPGEDQILFSAHEGYVNTARQMTLDEYEENVETLNGTDDTKGHKK